MSTARPFDPTAFHDFEHAGWERAAAFYGDTFGGLTAQAPPSAAVSKLTPATARSSSRCRQCWLRPRGSAEAFALPRFSCSAKPSGELG
jgi:hypothetical protein